MRRNLLPLFALALLPSAAAAQHDHPSATPYAGRQAREIKALSPDEIKALEGGEGMGLALAAELNGYPGPRHVLELATELSLTPEQEAGVRKSREAMAARAAELGRRIIAREQELDRAFAGRRITPAELDRLTASIADLQGQLRAVHLQAHLEVAALLTEPQRHRYDELRGYRTP